MRERDETFMTRAFELARQGAGLVSPNPMVGAVLVNEGRIVGEGYHRYDRLKHAETYAIEEAGELARGATLYCSLEPCCHYGRTSPCTDALIETGIARAVIAIEDSDPRVSGRGISQLRSAGIEVEVGLLRDEALRINECYFKYVITGIPFVHGVIINVENETVSIPVWSPSDRLMEEFFRYDAIVIGCDLESNRSLINACLTRKRHRPFIIAGAADALQPFALESQMESEPLFLRLSSPLASLGELSDSLKGAEEVKPDLNFILQALARMRATSCAILVNSRDWSLLADIPLLDRLTLVLPGSNRDEAIKSLCAWDDLNVEISDVKFAETGRYIEVTAYPRECYMSSDL